MRGLQLGLLLAAIPLTARACSTSDIKIIQADLVRQEPSGLLLIVGELENTCSQATSVTFHVTLRDDANKVVSASDPSPAGTRKIPAHSTYSFTLDADEPTPEHRGTKFQIDVVAVDEF
jgi:hypothetical protein